MNGLNDIVAQDAKEAGRWFSRDNLLINAYWGNKASIVNQRGKDEYVGKGYTIDGWAQSASPAENGIVRVTDSGLQFVATGDKIRFYWLQILDESLQAELGGETVTASVLTTTDLYSFTVKLPSDISRYDSYVNGHYASFDGFVFDIYLGAFRFWSRTIDATSTVRAAKLEKGVGQTLAHRENGVWVKNDETDYDEELRKCRYYFRKLVSPSGFNPPSLLASYASGNVVVFAVLLNNSFTMRARPAVKLNGVAPNGRVTFRNTSTGKSVTGTLSPPTGFTLTDKYYNVVILTDVENVENFTIGCMYEAAIELDARL